MGVKNLEELVAYRVARALKLEVYRLVKAHPAAVRDLEFRSQIFEAAKSVESNIAEGFGRFLAGDMVRFLRISQGSVKETERCLQDGVDRGHYASHAIDEAKALADRTGRLLTGLIVSLQPFVNKRSRRPRFPSAAKTHPHPTRKTEQASETITKSETENPENHEPGT